jgi:uncharacterized protein
MSPEERQMLADLFERIRANAAAPRDPQADAFINDAVRQQPFAPYILAQTVLVQQHALDGAAQRISELEAQTRASAPAQETSFLGSLGRSLFGGGAAPPPQPQRPSGYDASAYQRGAPQAPPSYAPPPPPPGYAPPPQPGPWGAAAAAPAGGGFLSGAIRTAAGVAGGVVLGNALENMIGGRGGGLFGGGSALAGGKEGGGETINNYYENAPDAAGQHAQDVLQDQDQDQDDAQDAQDDSYDSGSSDSGSWDT